MFSIILPLRIFLNSMIAFPKESYTPKFGFADDNGNYLTTQR